MCGDEEEREEVTATTKGEETTPPVRRQEEEANENGQEEQNNWNNWTIDAEYIADHHSQMHPYYHPIQQYSDAHTSIAYEDVLSGNSQNIQYSQFNCAETMQQATATYNSFQGPSEAIQIDSSTNNVSMKLNKLKSNKKFYVTVQSSSAQSFHEISSLQATCHSSGGIKRHHLVQEPSRLASTMLPPSSSSSLAPVIINGPIDKMHRHRSPSPQLTSTTFSPFSPSAGTQAEHKESRSPNTPITRARTKRSSLPLYTAPAIRKASQLAVSFSSIPLSDTPPPPNNVRLNKMVFFSAPVHKVYTQPYKQPSQPQQEKLIQKRHLDKNYEKYTATTEPPLRRISSCRNLQYIDAHMHLDLMQQRMPFNSIDDLKSKFPDAFPRNFMGMIANFVDPELFMSPTVVPMNTDICTGIGDIGTDVNAAVTYLPAPPPPIKDSVQWMINQIEHPLVLGTSIGCHPHNAASFTPEVENFIRSLVSEKRQTFKILAIGETGIDFHRNRAEIATQLHCFKEQLKLANELQLPVVIHCRDGPYAPEDCNAEDICLTIMQNTLSRFHSIHRHCFTGSWEVAQKWINAFPNIVFGFTPCIYDDDRERYRELVRRMPLSRIVLETDAPYFNVNFAKKSRHTERHPFNMSVPPYAGLVAVSIADTKRIDLATVLRATRENTVRVYGLPSLE